MRWSPLRSEAGPWGAGVDPKSILCQYFKAGTCQKGAKCKFSHDLNIERKSEKIDLYSDNRRSKEDEAKKGGAYNRARRACAPRLR